MRTEKTPGYTEKRSVGRRAADRGVCMFHDMCHETVAEMKQNCINNTSDHKEEHDNMDGDIKSKLDWKVFALFVGGVVTIGVAFMFFVAPMVMNMAEAVTTIKVNQQHLMEELSVKPIK
jgi:hypothetical protein